MKDFASVMLGFCWDNPRASVVKGAVWLAIGLAASASFWVGGPARDFYAGLSPRWVGIIGLASFICTLLGALNLTFGGAGWLFRYIRRSRR